jgi:hypothetical protein
LVHEARAGGGVEALDEASGKADSPKIIDKQPMSALLLNQCEKKKLRSMFNNTVRQKIMKIDELVDLPLLVKRLQQQGNSAFGHWKDTAQEVCPNQYKRIQMIYTCYADLKTEELFELRYQCFVEEILHAIPTLEDKKRLLQIEALQEKKF